MHPFAFVNTTIEELLRDPNWGNFIAPDLTVSLNAGNLQRFSSPDFNAFTQQHPLFKNCLDKILSHPHQVDFDRHPSSAQYYVDAFQTMQAHLPSVQRVVKVGVFLGNFPCLLAGLIESTLVSLDLVDIHKQHLYIAYRRIFDLYPTVASRVRLFFGDLPSYVARTAHQKNTINMVHYNGSYNFNEIVNDLASLSFIKEKVLNVLTQHVNLRSVQMSEYVFPDLAMLSVFGLNIHSQKLGQMLQTDTEPNIAQQEFYYRISQRVEGLSIPLAENVFRYPHPRCNTINDFLLEDLEAVIV